MSGLVQNIPVLILGALTVLCVLLIASCPVDLVIGLVNGNEPLLAVGIVGTSILAMIGATSLSSAVSRRHSQ
jgi:hypothetical protein